MDSSTITITVKDPWNYGAKKLGHISKRTYYEIDKGMRDIIVTLNNKNYFTAFCCEGHLDQPLARGRWWDGYLSFCDNYDFAEPFPCFEPRDKNDKKKKQSCWSVYEEKNIMKQCGLSTYYWYGTTEQERLDLLDRIKEWANRLPKRELNYRYSYQVWRKGKRGAVRPIEYFETMEEALNCVENIPDGKYTEVWIDQVLLEIS